MTHPLLAIPEAFRRGEHLGITSVCSAHPIVVEAALLHGKQTGRMVLVEATCNQVNQDGGYTGMTPADFRIFVEDIAARVGLPASQIIFGGDHLGPNPWKALSADAAMDKATGMIEAYAKAGFTKLHLDTSMGCAGEPIALADEVTAARAARLAEVAEGAKGALDPVYVIGTEVPVPGGATHALDHLELTKPSAVMETHAVHRTAFQARGLDDAFSRVIALVVQPGVEFGHTDIVHFEPAKARELSQTLKQLPGIVFEAHSTDYQAAGGLKSLVDMGFSILKVGPWLTFALREALYALDGLADILDGHEPRGQLMAAMERAMQDAPDNWKKYYSGGLKELWLQRHFSFSDRIRYYWPTKTAQDAVGRLMDRLGERTIPTPVARQFFSDLPYDADPLTGRALLLREVTKVLDLYEAATR